MTTIIRGVRDLENLQRQQLELIVGRDLRDSEQVVIRIVDHEAGTNAGGEGDSSEPLTDAVPALPEWCHVYAGLSDEEIAEVERIALTRANLTRRFE
jgi:hypothetical protein